MATVDLEALEAELMANGIEADIQGDGVEVNLEVTHIRVWRNGMITEDDGTVMNLPLDIIRRHVAPAPPVVLTEEERDQLARAMHHHMHSISGHLNYDTMTEETREYRRGSIDAVLAKLAELGIVLTREARP